MRINIAGISGSPALPLAKWILSSCDNVSNLKLQKLLFYCYGVALAYDYDEEIGEFDFEAWKYGPVERNVYKAYSQYGSSFIPKPKLKNKYSNELNSKLNAVIKIYGNLTPMELVRQSHLETPWISAWEMTNSKMSSRGIKKHFKAKFIDNPIDYPEVILDSGIFELDNIPVNKFKTIEELANALDAEKFL